MLAVTCPVSANGRVARTLGHPDGELVETTALAPVLEVDVEPRGESRRLTENGEQRCSSRR